VSCCWPTEGDPGVGPILFVILPKICNLKKCYINFTITFHYYFSLKHELYLIHSFVDCVVYVSCDNRGQERK